MDIKKSFKNVFSYAAGVEEWCRNYYAAISGRELNYTFCNDFAVADWCGGKKAVIDTYNQAKRGWIGDYKAFTEVAIALNLLSWANYQLTEQGIDGREQYTKLYAQLYYKCRDDFYTPYSGNDEATDYFFEMTD